MGTSFRKKTAKELHQSNTGFYVKFLIGIALIEAYFAYNFSAVQEFSNVTV